MNSIEKKVLQIACGVLGRNETELTLNTALTDMDIDSIVYLELLVDIECEFEIEFEDEDLLIETFTSIGDIVDAVRRKTLNC